MRSRITLTLALTVIVVVLIAGSGTPGSNAALFIQRGDAYRDAYLYTAAVDQYLQALDRQPDTPILLLRLCDVGLRRGQPDESTTYADRAERANADPASVAECRARIAAANGQASESMRQWAIVAAARPADRAARYRLLDAQIAAHDWPAAGATAQALLDADSSDVTASFYVGALLALDDPLHARPYLDHVGTPEAAALVRALDDPLSYASRSYRAVSIGRVFLESDRLPLAWRAFVAATADAPNYSDAFAYLGITYERLGDATLAAAFLDRALEINPDSAVAHYLRGVYSSRRKTWDAARADLDRAAQLDAQNAPVALALGRVLAEQGDFIGAESQLLRAAALEPDNPDGYLALAEFYIGRLIRVADKGVPAAQRAVDLAPDSAHARDWLGWGLHLMGDHLAAEIELREAIRLDPMLARARLHLGNLLVDVGRIEEGRTELQRAVDLDPAGEVGSRARQLLGQP